MPAYTRSVMAPSGATAIFVSFLAADDAALPKRQRDARSRASLRRRRH